MRLLAISRLRTGSGIRHQYRAEVRPAPWNP